MAEEKFILCHHCNEVHHVTPYDKAPLYSADRQKDDELSVDDWQAFMNQHVGHRLEALRSADSAFWEGGTLDPMQERYVEVSNGREWFVVRGFRRSVNEALCFEVVQGRLSRTKMTIEVQESEIRKEMKNHFYCGRTPSPDDKIELFIRIFKRLVAGLCPEEVRVARYDSYDGLLGYGGLDDRIVEALLQECAFCFEPEELIDLKTFLEDQRQSDGVMALRVKHQYGVERPIALSVGCDPK